MEKQKRKEKEEEEYNKGFWEAIFCILVGILLGIIFLYWALT